MRLSVPDITSCNVLGKDGYHPQGANAWVCLLMVVETLQYCLRQDINLTTWFGYCATSFLPGCVVHSFVFKASILYMCMLSILILCLVFCAVHIRVDGQISYPILC